MRAEIRRRLWVWLSRLILRCRLLCVLLGLLRWGSVFRCLMLILRRIRLVMAFSGLILLLMILRLFIVDGFRGLRWLVRSDILMLLVGVLLFLVLVLSVWVRFIRLRLRWRWFLSVRRLVVLLLCVWRLRLVSFLGPLLVCLRRSLIFMRGFLMMFLPIRLIRSVEMFLLSRVLLRQCFRFLRVGVFRMMFLLLLMRYRILFLSRRRRLLCVRVPVLSLRRSVMFFSEIPVVFLVPIWFVVRLLVPGILFLLSLIVMILRGIFRRCVLRMCMIVWVRFRL